MYFRMGSCIVASVFLVYCQDVREKVLKDMTLYNKTKQYKEPSLQREN